MGRKRSTVERGHRERLERHLVNSSTLDLWKEDVTKRQKWVTTKKWVDTGKSEKVKLYVEEGGRNRICVFLGD